MCDATEVRLTRIAMKSVLATFPVLVFVALFSIFLGASTQNAEAQTYRFNSVDVDGN